MKSIFLFILTLLILFGCVKPKDICNEKILLKNKTTALNEFTNLSIGARDNYILFSIHLNPTENINFSFYYDSSISSDKINLIESLSENEKTILSRKFSKSDSIYTYDDVMFKKYVFNKMKMLEKLNLNGVSCNQYRYPVDVFYLCSSKTIYFVNRKAIMSNEWNKLLKKTLDVGGGWFIKTNSGQ